MRTSDTTTLSVLCGVLLVAGAAQARPTIIASDNASGYSGGNYNGQNQGFGFGAFQISPATNDGNSGAFIGDSNSNGGQGGPGINTTGKAFGMYETVQNTVFNINRPFATTLKTGDVFSMSFDSGFITGGFVGFGLQDAVGNDRFNFNFIGGQAVYRVRDSTGDVNTTLGFTDGGLSVSFSLTSATTYSFTGTRNSDSATFTRTGSLIAGTNTGAIARLQVFDSQNQGGQQNDLFFNNLQITSATVVPESGAATLLLIGSALPLVGLVIRRKK